MGTSGTVTLDGIELETVSRTDTNIQVRTPSPSPSGEHLPLVVNYGTDGGAILDRWVAQQLLHRRHEKYKKSRIHIRNTNE